MKFRFITRICVLCLLPLLFVGCFLPKEEVATGIDANLQYSEMSSYGSSVLSISSQPRSQTKKIGQSVSFTVSARGGRSPYQYQWRKDGTDIVGAISRSFTLSNLSATDAAAYSVVVKDSSTPQASVTSNNAQLTVLGAVLLTIKEQPKSQTKTVGQGVAFSVEVTGGKTPYLYQWRKDGEVISGATNRSYSMSGLTVANNGQYSVVVLDSAVPQASVTSNSAQLTVLAGYPLLIKDQPDSQTRVAGQGVSFSVEVSGGTTPYFYQWRKEGTDIVGATNRSYSITNLTIANAGFYSVLVTDSSTPQGSITSVDAQLTVLAGYPFVIKDQPDNQTKVVGQGVSFSVEVSGGTSPYFYQWRKDGTDIVGATNRSYSMSNLTTANAGLYSVLVMDSSTPQGSVTSTNAQLTVVAGNPLRITSQPQSQTKRVGQSVSFSVSVSSGKTPYIYQWRKNGIDISGATGRSYSIRKVASADAGLYSVVVKDNATPQGSVTSIDAQLTIR